MKTLATIAATLAIVGVVSASSPATATGPQILYASTAHVMAGRQCTKAAIPDTVQLGPVQPMIFTTEAQPFLRPIANPNVPVGTTSWVNYEIANPQALICLAAPSPTGQRVGFMLIG
jgi:hypothetical protein